MNQRITLYFKRVLEIFPLGREHFQFIKDLRSENHKLRAEITQLQKALKNNAKPNESKYTYNQDGLKTMHNADFKQDKLFQSAYQRGVLATGGREYNWHWRVHVGLWAARTASLLDGDFVECGVNAGFLSSAIMHDLNWQKLNKTFYLLDTFKGVDLAYVTEAEKQDGAIEKNKKSLASGFYITNFEAIQNNFSEWKNTRLIKGTVPITLKQIDANKVAFLHIDMNCAPPEVEALRYLWPKLVLGAVILLDDYAYTGYIHQKHAMDSLAIDLGFNIASLPTGQGLIIKSSA
jgi:hypothetical protein